MGRREENRNKERGRRSAMREEELQKKKKKKKKKVERGGRGGDRGGGGGVWGGVCVGGCSRVGLCVRCLGDLAAERMNSLVLSVPYSSSLFQVNRLNSGSHLGVMSDVCMCARTSLRIVFHFTVSICIFRSVGPCI